MSNQIEFIFRCVGTEKIQISLNTDDLLLRTDACNNLLSLLTSADYNSNIIGNESAKYSDISELKGKIAKIAEVLLRNYERPEFFKTLCFTDTNDCLDTLKNVINIDLSNLNNNGKKISLEAFFYSKEQNCPNVFVKYVCEFQKPADSSQKDDPLGQASFLDNASEVSKDGVLNKDSESLSGSENVSDGSISEAHNESSEVGNTNVEGNQPDEKTSHSEKSSSSDEETAVFGENSNSNSDGQKVNLNSDIADNEVNVSSEAVQELADHSENSAGESPEHSEQEISAEASVSDSVSADISAEIPLPENTAGSSEKAVSDVSRSAGSEQPSLKNVPGTASGNSPVIEEPWPRPKVKPNPRTMWNNKPSPADIRFKKPDSDHKGFLVASEGLKVFGASQRGRSHAHVGSPRDDDFSILRTDKEDWNILIVADGAGSAKFSREGSRVACEFISRELNLKLSDSQHPLNIGIQHICSGKPRLERNDLMEIKKLAYSHIVPVVKAAISSIEAVMNNCREESVTLKDFATTLLLAVTKKIGSNFLIISFAIGDGAIVVYDQNESVQGRIVKDGKSPYTAKTLLMNTPDSGEFAGQTRFLTMKNLFTNGNELINRISVHVVDSLTAIMLMSDGVSDAKFETEYLMSDKSNWDKFWKDLTVTGSDDSPPLELSSEPRELSEQLLEWLNYWVVGNHDDRTIVVMYKYE